MTFMPSGPSRTTSRMSISFFTPWVNVYFGTNPHDHVNVWQRLNPHQWRWLWKFRLDSAMVLIDQEFVLPACRPCHWNGYNPGVADFRSGIGRLLFRLLLYQSGAFCAWSFIWTHPAAGYFIRVGHGCHSRNARPIVKYERGLPLASFTLRMLPANRLRPILWEVICNHPKAICFQNAYNVFIPRVQADN